MPTKRKVKEPYKPSYQDIVGMQAKIIGTHHLRPTEDTFGADDNMHDLIGKIGTIRDVILENDYLDIVDENGDAIIGVEYIEGVSMLNYSWSIEDIELITPKEDIKPKVLKFNPKRLFEGSKEDGNKHKRVSDGVSDKRRSKDKQPKRNANKTVVKRSSK